MKQISRPTNLAQAIAALIPLVAAVLIIMQWVACSKQTEAPSQPAKPPEPKNQTYRMINGRTVISLVSSDELEIRQDGNNIVCKYTKQEGKLRVVVQTLGTTTAKYFNITMDGLVDEDGVIYYEPAAYEKLIAQIELNGQLWAAVERDDVAAIEDFLRKGANIATYNLGRTVLVKAVEDGLTNAVTVLLKHRADPNQKVSENGETILWRAIAKGNPGIVELLLQNGARSGDKRADGITPLMHASSLGGGLFRSQQRKAGHDKIVSLLCETGVDLNAKDNDGYTALGWSLRIGNLEATKILVAAGASRTTGRDAFALAQGDEIKTDALRTPSEREERKTIGARYAQLLVGVWRDEESTLTYNTNGTKTVRLNSGRKVTGTWSVDADILTFDNRKGRIIELNDTTWILDINGAQWRATRVPKAELEQAHAKLEETRQMLIGTWRDADQTNVYFTIKADGTMEGSSNVASGKWSLDENVFISSSGKRYRIISIDGTSFVFKRLDDIWGGNFRGIKIK